MFEVHQERKVGITKMNDQQKIISNDQTDLKTSWNF